MEFLTLLFSLSLKTERTGPSFPSKIPKEKKLIFIFEVFVHSTVVLSRYFRSLTHLVIVHGQLGFLICRPQTTPNLSVAFKNMISKGYLARGTPLSSVVKSGSEPKLFWLSG